VKTPSEGISVEEFSAFAAEAPDEVKKQKESVYTEIRIHQCEECKFCEFCDALEYFCPCADKVVEMSI